MTMDLLTLLKTKDGEAIKTEMVSNKKEFEVSVEELEKQYDVTQHKVFDLVYRPKKEVKKPRLDESGREVKENGETVYEKTLEEVTRIGIPFQKIIVDRAVGFLNVTNIELSPIYSGDDEKTTVPEMVKQIWRANKLDFRNADIAEKLFSQCEVAELWYLVEDKQGFWDRVKAKLKIKAPKFQMKCKIIAPFNGDKLYPYFDGYGDMIAFGREYALEDSEGKKYTHFDVYTADYIYKFKAGTGGKLALVDNKVIPNPFKKIPVIYYRQDLPEWHRVQSMIEQFENRVSNTGDANDYFAYPIMFVEGAIVGFASKGERGKVLQGEKGSKAQYLSWEEAAESLKLEVDTLKGLIYAMTQTPNISFEEMKNLGDVSGVALKLMFLDAHMKASVKWGIFGEGQQRRINLIKAGISEVLNVGLNKEASEIDIEPLFTPFLPTNEKEELENLSIATSSGIMSKKTAREQSSLISDPEAEAERIAEEAEADLKRQQKELIGTLED